MDIKGVLILILIILILYVLIKYALDGPKIHTGIVSAQQTQVIQAKNIATTNSAAGSNLHILFGSISMIGTTTLNITNLFLCELPEVLQRENKPISTRSWNKCTRSLSSHVFQPRNNVLEIYQTIESGQTQGAPSGNTVESAGFLASVCKVTNIPIQKWCHVLVSCYGRTQDIYLDGKLVKTCVMDGIAKVNKAADVVITPPIQIAENEASGSFSGATANYQYFPTSLNPQQVYEIYKKGFGGNWLTNLLNMEVKVTFSKNGQVQKEYKF